MKLKINGIYKNTKVHILVAQAFIPNPDNKPYVNHINGIRHDNRAVNLEWVTPKENAKHKIFPNNSRSSRRVVQKTLDGDVVKIWNSITLASDTLKIDRGSITNCCSRKRNTAGGWFWMYYEDYVQHDPNEKWREIELDSRKIRVSSLGRVQLHNGLITQGSLDAGYLRFRDYRIHRFGSRNRLKITMDSNYNPSSLVFEGRYLLLYKHTN